MTDDRYAAICNLTPAILDGIAEGVFAVTPDLRVTFMNRAAEDLVDMDLSDVRGRFCYEVFRSDLCEHDCPLRESFRTGEAVFHRQGTILDPGDEPFPVSVSSSPIFDAAGNLVAGVESMRDMREADALRRELSERHSFFEMVSESPAMARVFELSAMIADSDVPVLIEGETGTGKELLARAIHHLSGRPGSLVAVNCAAIPETLFESELFGYKAGAFTGAVKNKPGRLAMADGGTLFLDEIGDVPLFIQTRLLRVLQDHVYEPLGATAPETASVRVIAATHRDMAVEVENGRFREDLYYRINAARIHLPPLRERQGDIPALTRHFISRYNDRQGTSVTGLSAESMARLSAYPFPGNIRELENAVSYACAICRTGEIGVDCLPAAILRPRLPANPQTESGIRRSVKETEKEVILDALSRHGGHRSRTAAFLGMHPSTLWRKMKALGIGDK